MLWKHFEEAIMSIRPRKPGQFQFRRPEELESREMLAGHSFAGFSARNFSSAPAIVQQARSQISGLVASALHSSEYASSRSAFTATLADAANAAATGTAKFQTGSLFGVTVNKLTISVTGAAADTPLDVSVTTASGTTSLGTITTDANGAGSLVLSSNPTGTETQFPAGLVIDGTTTISVGTLTGTFAASTNTGGGHGCHHGESEETESGGTSSGSTSSGSTSSGTSSTGTSTDSSGTFVSSAAARASARSAGVASLFRGFGRR